MLFVFDRQSRKENILEPAASRARFNSERAQENSIARIARPAGITKKEGPGRKIKIIPMSSMVPPIIKTNIFFSWRNSMEFICIE